MAGLTCAAFSLVALVTAMNWEASFRCVVVDGILGDTDRRHRSKREVGSQTTGSGDAEPDGSDRRALGLERGLTSISGWNCRGSNRRLMALIYGGEPEFAEQAPVGCLPVRCQARGGDEFHQL